MPTKTKRELIDALRDLKDRTWEECEKAMACGDGKANAIHYLYWLELRDILKD